MAITSSSPSEWSFPLINCTKRTSNKIPFSSACNPHPLFLQCPNSRTLLIRSSSCSAPVVLVEDACSPSQPPVQPLTELNLKFEDLRPSSFPETEDINGFICALFEDQQVEDLAYRYYGKAKECPDFKPQKSTLNHLIRYLTRSRMWGLIFSLSEDFRNFKVLPNSSACCALITTCVSARKFKLVNTLLDSFKEDEKVAVLAFDSAMKGYNRLHMYRSTIAVYELMVSAGIVLDSGCYCRIMEAHLRNGNYEKVFALFQTYKCSRKGYTPFQAQIYWLLCESLGRSGRPVEALGFFREMTKKGIPENHKFYSTIISSFSSIRKVEKVEELLKEAESKRMLRDPALFFKVVLLYVDAGLMEKTIQIVSMMKCMGMNVSDCISCTIINGFAKRRGFRAAAEVHEELISLGCVPGQVTYASIINVYCRLGQYSKAENAFSEMEQRGFDKCVVAYSSMVAMYGKTDRISDAMRLVAKMKERGCEPNVWIYNSLLDIHGRAINLAQVEKIWKEMKRRKIAPDKVSYTSIISASSKARDFEGCIKYYQEFMLNGGVVDCPMAGIMVAVFSKVNRIDDLVKLLQDMKSQGTKLDERLYFSASNGLRDAGLQVQAKWLQKNFERMDLRKKRSC